MAVDVDAYLRRIGLDRPPAADLAGLARLQLAHLRTVPFENLSIHLGEEIVLDESSLLEKVVTRRRGGFCFELNTAFAWLLRELGFSVTLLAARVFDGATPGNPLEHVALRVDLEEPWLADVGFGEFAEAPLRLGALDEQSDPSGKTFRFVEAGHGDLDVHQDGEPQFRLEAHPRELPEFRAMCWYLSHAPDSGFVKSPVCSRLADDGRITLSGATLKRKANGETTETTLDGPAAILAAYREHFGIELERVPDDPRRA